MKGEIVLLVSPASETSTGEDIHILQLWEEFREYPFTLKRWCWVTVVEATVIGGNDLIGRLDHLSVDKSLDGILKEIGVVDRLH